MTVEARRARIEALFDEALDLPAAARAAWLDTRVPDAELRRELRALLDAHEHSGGILDADAVAPALSLVGDPLRGRHVGPYRLLRELGRGGMGVVYLAERDDGQYRQRVALKLLRSGPDADELRRRFVAERQILASLSHPNIAQLLDGGVTDGQLPYLVMEYVDGLPITTYCDRHRLGVRERVRLFRAVCAAVHHAHQNLVIHRDLKPSNVLVTASGQVTLLDFGIAKLLNPTLGWDDQPLTRTDFRVLTPEYASPEQMRGESLSTTSDVYALGVVLYELLCGRRPFARRPGAPRELAPAPHDREPERPSTRVVRAERVVASDGSTHEIRPEEVGAARGASAERLRRQLQGDLDAIVLCALRVEPRRRYGSAELLAEDLQRHLDARAVMAHRGSRGYRLRKLLARHRVTATATALVLLSLGVGTAAAVRQASVARMQRDRAEEARRNAEDVTRFLVGLFEGARGTVGRGDTVSAADLLRRGVARIPSMADRPEGQARLLIASALVYRNLARYDEAAALLERAVALRQGDDARAERAAALYQLADVRRLQGRHTEALRLGQEALALRRAEYGGRHPDVAESLLQLSRFAVYRADLVASESLSREGLALRRAILGPDHRDVAAAEWMLASTVTRRGRPEEGERLAREALATYERVEGANGPMVGFMLLRLADFAEQQRHDDAAALALRRRAERIFVAAYGEADLSVAITRADVATSLAAAGEWTQAERMMRASLATIRDVRGPSHPDVAQQLSMLADLLRRRGKLGESEALQRESAAMWERYTGRRHNAWVGALGDLAHIFATEGRLGEADSLLALALRVRRDSMRETSTPGLAALYVRVAALRARQGRRVESDSLYRVAIAMYRRYTTDRSPPLRAMFAGLARLHEEWGHPAEAARWRTLAAGEPPVFELGR